MGPEDLVAGVVRAIQRAGEGMEDKGFRETVLQMVPTLTQIAGMLAGVALATEEDKEIRKTVHALLTTIAAGAFTEGLEKGAKSLEAVKKDALPTLFGGTEGNA